MLKGNLVAYSGMTTKIRAMKNKLLSPEQYEEITHFTTVAELISFLQTTPVRFEDGSSMTMTSGMEAYTEPHAICCFSPPDN